eukprot:UN03327
MSTLLCLLLMHSNCKTQYTTITGTWDDDFEISNHKWIESDLGSNPTTSVQQYHGRYASDLDGESELRIIARTFYCNQSDSSVEMTFSMYYCDTEAEDTVELFLNSVGNGAISADGGSSWNDNNICSGSANYKALGPYTIASVYAGNTFNVQISIIMGPYNPDSIYIGNIQIICHPLTPSPTDSTSNPYKSPTNNPTQNPTIDTNTKSNIDIHT